jgi:hypothetical protein
MMARAKPGNPRRRFAWASSLVFFLLLALPFVAQVTGFDDRGSTAENRSLAPAPAWPDNWAGLLALPRQTDAWLRDHFGFRVALVRANSRIRYALFHEAPTRQVLFGKGNRLFLSGRDESHPYSVIAKICGIDGSDAEVEAAAAGVRTLLRAADADAPGAVFVAVPSAPAIYAEDLPDWLARQCARPSSIERIVRRLDADPALAARVIYPIDALIAAKQTGRVIPLYNFHWSGRGARVAAEVIAGQLPGSRRAIDIPTLEQLAPSDLSNMVPGLNLSDRVVVPDYAAASLVYCYARPECLPGLGASVATVIGDYSRTLSPRSGSRRLLLLTDSYGSFIAPWFAAWFGEVRHISTNTIGLLSAAERATLRENLFRRYHPDSVIFLYHDGAVSDSPGRVAALLWPAPAVASAR